MNSLVFQDSLRAAYLHGGDAARPDSIASPLPGGVSAVVRFIFGVPQWIQIGGLVAGLVVAVLLAAWTWRRRAAIAHWIRSRERGVKIGMAVAVFLTVVTVGGAGAATWNYMEHDNGFCTGCHVMSQPFGQFQARSGKHDSLECHACHQQSIYASARQLVLWVAERPEKIGKHAKVPTAICSSCHVNGPEQKETWQRIAETAGHRVHFESDSSALADVQCVTCHGAEVHKFVPVSETCQQSGCHEQTTIALGGMAAQTSLHCTTCHQFTVEVPRLATRDSAAGSLVPNNTQCLSCHEMQQVLTSFDPARDPHSGTCGMCHDPHAQQVAAEAAGTCATSGCHANWRNEPFHAGVSHRKVGTECVLCHEPHSAKVDPSDCQSCHARVRAAGARLGARRVQPPVQFDTLRALRSDTTTAVLEPLAAAEADGREAAMLAPPEGGTVTGFLGWGLPNPPPRPAVGPVTPPVDSFPHQRHQRLPCLTCHTSNVRHGRLTFEAPRGCLICHHQSPRTSDCATCHRPDDLDRAASLGHLTVRVALAPVRTRTVPFAHDSHQATACVTCHVTPVTLAPSSSAGNCADCHDSHHGPAADCAACHASAELTAAHRRPVAAHQSCDACHPAATVSSLVPVRGLCLTCHAKERAHYPERECTVCHFLATPAEYRLHLLRRDRS